MSLELSYRDLSFSYDVTPQTHKFLDQVFKYIKTITSVGCSDLSLLECFLVVLS